MRKHLGEYFISFGIWGYLALLLSILSGINAYSNITGNPISIFALVPTWGWLTLLILGLLVTPFFAFHKIRTQLDSYENVQPNIVFEEVHESPLYHHEKGIVIPMYHVLQVWFKNKPVNPQEKSIAQRVTADIQFLSEDASKPLFRVSGQWNIAPHAPDFVGTSKTDNKIDIFPNDEFVKLFVALKWEDDNDAYGYAIESFIHSRTQDGRDSGRKLPQGKYSVYMKLKGVGVDKPFWFTLINPGKGKSLELQVKS